MQTPCSWLLFDHSPFGFESLEVPPESGTLPTVRSVCFLAHYPHFLEIGLKSILIFFYYYFANNQTNAYPRPLAEVMLGHIRQ